MGLGWPHISFMLAARSLGVSYERSLMIGRQWLFARPENLTHAYEMAGQTLDPGTARRLVEEGQGYAEPVFRGMGAQQVDSLDASSYEGSNIIHDLNQPLTEELRGRWSVVVDSGSLEHVFNFPAALKNCLLAVEPGGHFITITTANSFLGHGFYQFSPELFFRALSAENGFEVVTMLLRHEHHWARWYAVADPARVGERVMLSSPWPATLYVVAKRISDVEPLAAWPQQSDYVSIWGGGDRVMARRPLQRVLERLPFRARRGAEALLAVGSLTGRRSAPSHFRPLSMADVARGAARP